MSFLIAPAASGLDDPRPEPNRDDVAVYYWGTVTAVTKDSITIRYKDWKPKTFPVSDALAAGEIPMNPRVGDGLRPYEPGASSMYRLSDVRVGDWVNIDYAQISGKSICDHINISKRPGGKMPPLPKEAEDLIRTADEYIPYHEQMKAHWDLEDSGIAYPEKFGLARRFPTAPPPREKK